MLVSMTGFGRGESKDDHVHVVVEVRSLNNRFLDISARLPKSLSGYENQVKDIVRKKVSRGRINISLSVQSTNLNYLGIRFDYDVAQGYKDMLSELKNQLKLEGGVRLEHLLNFSEIFTPVNGETRDEDLWQHSQKALVTAIEEMNQMRQMEGKNLSKDMLKRVDGIRGYIGEIEELSRKHIPKEFHLLKQRIKEILQSTEIDSNRLEMEIALLADRLDVTEECVRFYSHIHLFQELVRSNDLVGRRLNFLLQEMNREANTIGSKANNAEISHRVVFIKEEIEKLREQVQNIE